MGQVVNVEKYKNSTAISKVADHNLRQQHSNNVDPDRSKDNVYLVGSADLDVLELVKTKLEGIKYRKDANKVCNVVFSASNEEMSKIDPVAWANEITRYMEEKVGKENVLYSVLHRDELTPHLHFSFVPIIDNKLRSNVYFDGPAKMNKFRQEIYQNINKKYRFKKDQPKADKPSSGAIAEYYKEVKEFDKLQAQIELEFQKIEDLPTRAFLSNPKKMFTELMPTFQKLMKFTTGLRVHFSQLGTKYKALKKKQLESDEKIQQLDRRVASLELKLQNLGLDPDISLKQCMQLKPTIAEMTAIAEAAKLANSKLPQDVKNSVDYSTSNEVKNKFKPK